MSPIWIEQRKARYRWLGFVDCLNAGIVELLRVPDWPRSWLPLASVQRMARVVGPWLLAVLDERQQRGLGWNAATGRRLLTADLAARPIEPGELPQRANGLRWGLEGALHRLIRLAEAPEDALGVAAREMPSQARYRALAIGLVRLYQLYSLLEQTEGAAAAQKQWQALAARVRQAAGGSS